MYFSTPTADDTSDSDCEVVITSKSTAEFYHADTVVCFFIFKFVLGNIFTKSIDVFYLFFNQLVISYTVTTFTPL